MANEMVSPAKLAKALGVTRRQVKRLAENAGIGCIYTHTSRPYYSSQNEAKRGSCRYLLKDAITLIDRLYAGDRNILSTVKKALSKQATYIKDTETILRGDASVIEALGHKVTDGKAR